MRHPPAGRRAPRVPSRARADHRSPRVKRVRRGRTHCHRMGAIAALMTGFLALIAAPAHAHDALLGSEPPDGALLTDAPSQVVLTFASPQAEIGAEVVVTGPDGAAWSDGAAVVAGTTVTQPLRDGLSSGEYLVQWRSVAADGHPVDGTLSFALELPIEPTTEPVAPVEPDETVQPEVVVATPTETPVVLADVAVDPGDGFPSFVPWLAGGAFLAVVIGFALVLVSRRRAT